MLPTAYEFHWDLGHVVFLGIFYGVVCAVLGALGCAGLRAWRDMRRQKAATLEWEEIFSGLPAERRVCRHGLVDHNRIRLCDHGFDCATCPDHQRLSRECELPESCRATGGDEVGGGPEGDPGPGLTIHGNRLYHRGHSWAEPRPDGTFTVGLDPFITRCLGRIEEVVPPSVGQMIQGGEHCLTVRRGSLSVRIPAPVRGRVVALGGRADPWLYRVQPGADGPGTENLLQGAEARLWLLREWEWLQGVLAPADGTATAADGGTPVADLVRAYPRADWDGIWGLACLDA